MPRNITNIREDLCNAQNDLDAQRARNRALLENTGATAQEIDAATAETQRLSGRVNLLQDELTAEERLSLDTAWKSLPAYGNGSENALAVIDGSGSMYRQTSPSPISAALSLGIYFAEHNRGAFANHFITFSARPQLVEIKGQDIFEKVQYCARYNEVANTDLEAVFLLILRTAVRNRLPQSEMPAKLFIISDMEFDFCVTGGNQMTLFDAMQKLYRQNGYTLPQIVFWNVASRQENIPVTRSQTGAALVSGASPSVFDVVINGKTTPEAIMYSVVERERYMKIS